MPDHLFVFTHPNHEIAVLGSVKRYQPHILYLTDGGGVERVQQTRTAMRDYVPEENLFFLNHAENALYAALLAVDGVFYEALAAQIREHVMRTQPKAVYCDAVEFYNPVHDCGLPLARRALSGMDIPLYEVPLVYQREGTPDAFEMQRTPQALEVRHQWLDLSTEELGLKTGTIKSGVYGSLFSTLGGMITNAIPSHASRELVIHARDAIPQPLPGQVLRYETRGKYLAEKGDVPAAITYDAHYVPVFKTFFQAS
jgi:hypothetical protein